MPSIQEAFELLKTVASAERLKAILESTLTGWPAYAALFAIVFAETGLLAGFFLPGDSLLFVVGVLCGAGKLDFGLVILLLSIAAITGDAVGYYLGRTAGKAAFERPDSRFFKREYLEKTQQFYEKHGGKTIIYARFVPIIRTFAPFVAGIGKMSYPRFLSFNVFGGLGWVIGLTGMGYLLGDLPFVKKYFDKVILGIILLSVTPILWEAFRTTRKPKPGDSFSK
jgi:membrane-associated protein